MGRIVRGLTVCIALLSMGLGIVGCGGTTGGSPLVTYMPTWIAASWSGGAAGPPTDRTDTDADEWMGQICPANSVELTNYGGEFAGLQIVNNCTISMTYALCVSEGSPPQPQNGLNQCATDPHDTPLSDLKFYTINPGPLGDYINTNESLSLNVFFCSDEQSLTGPPLRCL